MKYAPMATVDTLKLLPLPGVAGGEGGLGAGSSAKFVSGQLEEDTAVERSRDAVAGCTWGCALAFCKHQPKCEAPGSNMQGPLWCPSSGHAKHRDTSIVC